MAACLPAACFVLAVGGCTASSRQQEPERAGRPGSESERRSEDQRATGKPDLDWVRNQYSVL